jgi:KaiC/GvpD/RAD55 family RecA-like ATPase
MESAKNIAPKELVTVCGGYRHAIDVVMALDRTLWSLAFSVNEARGAVYWPQGKYASFTKNQLLVKMAEKWGSVPGILLSALKAKKLCAESEDGEILLRLDVFQPYFLARTLLSGVKPDHELRYFVIRNIRNSYHCNLSPRVAHLFHLLASVINVYREDEVSSSKPRNRRSSSHIWNYSNKLLPFLRAILATDLKPKDDKSIEEDINLFIECCRAVGYLRPSYKDGCIDIRAASIDAAFLLSNLFGIPTAIPGFDELFGGGGLMLTERTQEADSDALGGRTVLVMGRYGTGKSLLSLQLAVEVARKGGAAWVIPLEQSAQECLYSLEAMRSLPTDQSIIVAADVLSKDVLLKGENDDRGALIILKTVKDSFDDFLATIVENAKQIERYPLRLVVADPINSVSRKTNVITQLRSQTLEMFEEMKLTGTNVLLVAEEDTDPKNELLFEQNIADTVIHLSVDKKHGYAARYFEVRKSRLQREQRGHHPFSIVSGAGPRIYPSSAAVNARVRPRDVSKHKEFIKFGLPSLDDILKEGALTAGDVIVFQGSGGSFKTPLGLTFLLASDASKRRNYLPARSLLISVRDEESSVRYMLEQDYIKNYLSERRKTEGDAAVNKFYKTPDHIRICSLQRGYIFPGYILQRIEEELVSARLNGYWIDRIMIDNVAHWEMSCPFVRDDDTFGDTLLDFLRRQKLTSLLTCGDPTTATQSVVQKSIIDGADCLIRFDRIDFRGTHRVMIQVLKTRGMRHRGESFEVTLGPQILEVKPTSSLLRTIGGEIRPAKIRLFLNSQSSIRKEYNNRLLDGIQSVLSQDAVIESQERIYKSGAMRLGTSSAVDELQVFQLDEFQLIDHTVNAQSSMMLYTFPPDQWDKKEWNDFIPKLTKRVYDPLKGFNAVPAYENISLLAYRADLLADQAHTSWKALAEECERWEEAHPEPHALFFDFPKSSAENYNCLFFEILLSLMEPSINLKQCHLAAWVSQPAAIEAGKIFRRLCRKAYASNREDNAVVIRQLQEKTEAIKLAHQAVVWRHWYTTLNQMLYELGAEEREKIKVAPLPGRVSVAGEWYCAVTAYSAAPDVGLEIIKLMTSREAEIDRLQSGVGLPTRFSFYKQPEKTSVMNIPISPYFSMDIHTLNELITNSFSRSKFGCYSQLTNILAYHLQRVITIPDGDDNEIEERIKNIFMSFETSISFVMSDQQCANCLNRATDRKFT